MRICGSETLVLGKIQDQTQKSEIQSGKEVFSDTEGRKRKEAIRGKAFPMYENSSDVLEAVKQANKATEAVNIGLQFEVHEKTSRIMVQVIDMDKNEVLKEIPPEKILNLIGQIQEMIGLVLDEKR